MTPAPSPDRRPQAADAVSATAASLADEVLAEAVEEARRRARERLTDLLADAIVGAAQAPVPPAVQATAPQESAPQESVPRESAPRESDPRESAPRETSPREGVSQGSPPPAAEPHAPPGEEVLYLYAVTRSDVPAPAVSGLDGATPVSTLDNGAVALVVSRVDPALLHGLEEEPVTEDGRLATLVRRHDAVVTAAFAQAPVLPLRFGTVLRDEDAAAQFVSARAGVLAAQLDHLAGHEEFTVRVLDHGTTAYGDGAVADEDTAESAPGEDASTTGSARGPAPVTEDSPGTDYLARRRDELAARDARRTRLADLRDATASHLATHAVDSIAGRGRQHEGVVSETSYLVAREKREDFLAASERASAELSPSGLALTVQGPWPPYSFARVEPQEGTDG